MTSLQKDQALYDSLRRELLMSVNSKHFNRSELEAEYGKDQVWSLEELAAGFYIHAFSAPFVVVTRRSDKVVGSVKFQHEPRWYFDFEAYDGNEDLPTLKMEAQ